MVCGDRYYAVDYGLSWDAEQGGGGLVGMAAPTFCLFVGVICSFACIFKLTRDGFVARRHGRSDAVVH